MGTPHHHQDENGVWVKCFHKCRITFTRLVVWALALLIAFPLEHFVWVKLLPSLFPEMHPIVAYLMAEH